jgi:hypothetical protein
MAACLLAVLHHRDLRIGRDAAMGLGPRLLARWDESATVASSSVRSNRRSHCEHTLTPLRAHDRTVRGSRCAVGPRRIVPRVHAAALALVLRAVHRFDDGRRGLAIDGMRPVMTLHLPPNDILLALFLATVLIVLAAGADLPSEDDPS